jgi:hypothetical protein
MDLMLFIIIMPMLALSVLARFVGSVGSIMLLCMVFWLVIAAVARSTGGVFY